MFLVFQFLLGFFLQRRVAILCHFVFLKPIVYELVFSCIIFQFYLYLWEVLCLLSVHLVAYILCFHVLFFSLQVTHYFSFSFFILFSFLFFRFKIVLIYFNTLVMLIACLGSGKVKLCIVFVWRKVFIAFLCGDVTGKYFTLSSFDDIFSLVI